MQVASAVGEPQLRWCTEMNRDVLSEYNEFGEQCFSVYWTSLLKAAEGKAALTPGQVLPIVGALLLRVYKAMMSRKCFEIAATRRQALEKAERTAREELRGLLKATGDSALMPDPVLHLAAEEYDGGGQLAGGNAGMPTTDSVAATLGLDEGQRCRSMSSTSTECCLPDLLYKDGRKEEREREMQVGR